MRFYIDDNWIFTDAAAYAATIPKGMGLGKENTVRIERDLAVPHRDNPMAEAPWRGRPETDGYRARGQPVILGKDPSAPWQNGLDIRAWIATGMSTQLIFDGLNTTNIQR